MKPHLCLDGSLIQGYGISTYIRSLLPTLEENFSLTLLPYKAPLYSVREQFALWRHIPPCDIFWSPHINVPLFPIPAKKRLTTIHDTFHLTPLAPIYTRLLAKPFYYTACRASDAILTVSQFSKNELLTYCKAPAHKIEVIPLGINPNPLLQKDASLKYELPTSYILGVGSMKPHKNIDRLIQAYEALNPVEKLVLVGKKIKTANPSILSLGYVEEEDLPALYAGATLFVFPSLYEGFGYPPLEAMAAGCPVLISSAGSLPEVCGEAAYYVNPSSVSSIQKGLAFLLNNRPYLEELKRKGFYRAQTFCLSQTRVSTLKFLERLLSL